MPTKIERLNEIFRRIQEAPASAGFDQAYELLSRTIDAVEDELTSFPNEPERWNELPRLFPVQQDKISSVEGCEVKRLDSRRHVTYIASNGAMEFRSLRLENGQVKVHLSKAGRDGRYVCDICPRLRDANL